MHLAVNAWNFTIIPTSGKSDLNVKFAINCAIRSALD